MLELHVLGAGKGESLIIRLPTGEWGVVDCYSTSLANPDGNLTLRFLRAREVRELEFLCLTHPHEDHFRGMTQLLEALCVRRFWRPPVMTGANLRQIVGNELREAAHSGESSIRENARELEAIFDRVKDMRDSGRLKPEFALSDREIRFPSPPARPYCIWVVAPTPMQVDKYHDGLGKNFDANWRLKAEDVSIGHNRASIGLVVDYGKTRLVLGGDVEKDCWSEALQEPGLADRFKAATLVKVSHHGSKTGYCQGLWPHFASGGRRPIAVIAPFHQHRLPRPDAWTHISEHADEILVTDGSTPRPDDAAFPQGFARLPSAFALRREFTPLRFNPHVATNCWSFQFDDQGECVARNLSRV